MMVTTSSGSPVGSEIFAALALFVLSLLVLLIIRYYLPLRTTPAYLLVPVFLALWLPAYMVILMPIDLSSSATIDDDSKKGIWLPHRLILVSWRITYWLTFVLTWYGTKDNVTCSWQTTDGIPGSSYPSSPSIPIQATANPKTECSILYARMPNTMPSCSALA
jgi:hypothetical protein